MASSLLTSLHCSGTTTPILVSFWSARQSMSKHWLQVFSEDTTKRNPLQTSSTLAVRFSAKTQDVIVIEEVKSYAKAGSCVRGILRLPFADLKEPSFEYGKKTGNTICISLSLHQGTELREQNYSTEVLGKWKNGARHMLQTRPLGKQQAKTGSIEIQIQKASNTPSSIRKQILDIYNQSSTPRMPLMPSPSEHDSMSISRTPEEGAVAALRATVMEVQEQLRATDQKHRSSQTEVQQLRNTVSSLRERYREDAAPRSTEAHDELVRENAALRIKVLKIQSQRQGLIAGLKNQTVSQKERIAKMEQENEDLKKRLQAPTPLIDFVTEENLVELSGLNFASNEEKMPGTFPMYSDTQDSSNGSGSVGPGSSHTAFVGGDRTEDNDVREKPRADLVFDEIHEHSETNQTEETSGVDIIIDENHAETSKTAILSDGIYEIYEAVQKVANIQVEALRSGKAVRTEIREVEDMPAWLNGEDAGSPYLRRVLTLQWTWARPGYSS